MSVKKIAILYGSETGNAHEFASVLSYKLHRLHFPHTLLSFGNYAPRDLLECRYLFVISSTTGQGELPRNVKENATGQSKDTLWTFLKKKNLPEDFLSHVRVTMLGLGDSSYPKFNYAIRKLHKRVVDQLGAKEIFPRLEGDELGLTGSNGGTGTGVEAVYFEYEKRALKYLVSKFPDRKMQGKLIKREPLADDVFMKPEFKLQVRQSKIVNCSPIFKGDPSIKVGKVCENTRLTHQEHFQDVRQFVFESDSESYEPGDTVALYPNNRDDDVNAFFELQPHWLQIADKPLEIEGTWADHDGGVVAPLTLRNVLKYHCEITGIPRKTFFMKIWMFATDKAALDGSEEQLIQQRDKLRQFAVDEDMDDLYDYCNRPRRSLLEVLRDFPSISLPWEYVLSYLPLIKPRLFSISSEPSNPNIELTVAIVKYKTILRKIRRGLCTDYLQSLQKGDTVRYKLQKNSLLKASMQSSPVILISPGVGLAPMMSLLKADFFQDVNLFFGNRVKERDFLYRDVLESWNKVGKIALHTCFSRDPLHSPNAKYVQDVLWQKGEILADLILKKNAIVYICGSSGKMPVQVRLTILEILKKWGEIATDGEVEAYLKDMERENRYLQETW
ncbi:LANO_0E06634g1_1 [Lachancea nothofagi CBS 11611]|uniref:NADPH-dependent diflavin oxidoreductase 1 n=1 Tax=Lachancea nothofagi CBS 11611 TaxID=1266666 RepID=A0A1G4JUC7_9SACH|nr:LANO_0E06634g1_1 [Lachancea nothofagi CBS 11611]